MPRALSLLLAPISLIYKTLSLIGWLVKAPKKTRFPGLFIVSVDNLTFGGSGKTTLVTHLGRLLQQRALPFAIVSRGYRSAVKTGHHAVSLKDGVRIVGDEALLLKEQFPSAPVLIGPDRRGALSTLSASGPWVVILDDGFQSAHIGKDLSLLLHTPRTPFSYYRHFRFMARHADLVITLSQGESEEAFMTSPPLKYRFRQLGFRDGLQNPVALGDAAIVAFSALGDNARFRRDLSHLAIKAFHPFPDHHFYRDHEIEGLKNSMRRHRASYCVCTRKDFVKLPREVQLEPTFIYAENHIQCNFDLLSHLLTHERFAENAALFS